MMRKMNVKEWLSVDFARKVKMRRLTKTMTHFKTKQPTIKLMTGERKRQKVRQKLKIVAQTSPANLTKGTCQEMAKTVNLALKTHRRPRKPQEMQPKTILAMKNQL